MTSTPRPTGSPTASGPLTLAVVVPTLNEAAVLPGLLASLRGQTRLPDRVVVADGGSTDGTANVGRRAGVEVLICPGRGRGGQIASAVATLAEDVVLVLHADMVLPPRAVAAVIEHLELHPGCPGGCLGHRFDRRSPLFRLIEWWDRRRARGGMSFGDQAQFFRREALVAVGGFPDQPMMEDVELSLRLQRLGHPAYLDVPVTVSARRYERHGWWKVWWANRRILRRYRREGPTAARAIYDEYYRT
jgi:glycosyltransferase involved in cell wall biosynthesis